MSGDPRDLGEMLKNQGMEEAAADAAAHLGETCDDHPASNPRVEGRGILRYFNPRPALRRMELDFSSAEMRDAVTTKHEVTILDARKGPQGLDSWQLAEHGFTFIRAPEPVKDFFDSKLVRAEYAPRVLEAVKKATGASRAFWLNHVARTENFPPPSGGLALPYARFAHSDYGPSCLGLGVGPNLGSASPAAWPTDAEARRLLRERFKVPEEEANTCGICFLGIWAPTDWPAYKDPLCLLDCSSVRMDAEVIPYEYRGQYSFAALAPVYSPEHRWVYCPDMRPEEMLLWKQYDCREDVKTKCCFHHAFPDSFHAAWKECPPRHSFDARLFVTFDAPQPTPAQQSKL